MSRGEKSALMVGVVVALALAGWYYWGHQPAMTSNSEPQQTAQRLIHVGDTSIYVETVASQAARERGLSGRDELAPNTGMLFVFGADGPWGIWMKGMKFGIDILWLAQDGTVITVAPNVSPGTYPKSFYPTAPARYVLELPAGFAGAHSINVGSRFAL